MVDAKARNMKCLTFFLMLPESVKSKSSKSSKKGNSSGSSKLPPVCYEIITLRSKKKKKMAADIFPTKKSSSTTTVQQYQQQNLNNNNTIHNCNWQGLYSTIRERNSVMFNNELMADVHFVVGQPGRTQRLPGHRVSISPTIPKKHFNNREEMNTQVQLLYSLSHISRRINLAIASHIGSRPLCALTSAPCVCLSV
ncbi:hypothetical protein NL108_014989 [Boleophthalmus pectinirostris]|nr:hypothetical protein NL108_014989 [Boleophthalmus pectinirostris]